MSTYNPRSVEEYFGKTFVTQSGSRYGISADGRFTGQPSIEGAEILLIAGFSEDKYWMIRNLLGKAPTDFPRVKRELDDLIIEEGMRPYPGLHLVVSLKPDSVKKTERFGLISPIIKSVE